MRALTQSSKHERSGHSRSLSFPSVCVWQRNELTTSHRRDPPTRLGWWEITFRLTKISANEWFRNELSSLAEVSLLTPVTQNLGEYQAVKPAQNALLWHVTTCLLVRRHQHIEAMYHSTRHHMAEFWIYLALTSWRKAAEYGAHYSPFHYENGYEYAPFYST